MYRGLIAGKRGFCKRQMPQGRRTGPCGRRYLLPGPPLCGILAPYLEVIFGTDMQIGKTRFYDWLLEQQHGELRQLRAKAESEASWKRVKDFPGAWALITADPTLTQDEKNVFVGMAVLAFQSFDSAQPKTKTGWATAFGFGVFLFMALILGILFLAIFEPTVFPSRFGNQTVEPLLSRLSDLETSRGLITFVFTVGVIALALIIVTANVTSSDGEGQRFERSKEILTSLIAILGTILGFYFGKAEPATPVPDGTVQTDAAEVAAADPTEADPEETETAPARP